MVAPKDLGVAAAGRLTSSIADSGIRHVEGPARYSPADVAAAFANALQRPVALAVTPREQWIDAYLRLGFSRSAAESYARMTAVSVDGGFDSPDEAIRGSTSLNAYIRELVARSAAR